MEKAGDEFGNVGSDARAYRNALLKNLDLLLQWLEVIAKFWARKWCVWISNSERSIWKLFGGWIGGWQAWRQEDQLGDIFTRSFCCN